MKGHGDRSGEVPRAARTAARDVLELWIALARREWGSLVLVPTDRDGSTADIANTLADIGQRLSYGSVTAITVTQLEYGSALALADLQQHIERERKNWGRTPPTVSADMEPAGTGPGAGFSPGPAAGAQGSAGTQGGPTGPEAPTEGSGRSEALVVVPPARLIISVPPVVMEPLGLAAAEEADAVVLAVRMYHSRMADVRRTMELVGRKRITGCFLVR